MKSIFDKLLSFVYNVLYERLQDDEYKGHTGNNKN